MSRITIDQAEVDSLVIEAVRSHIGAKLDYNRTLISMVEEALESQRPEITTILNETLASVVTNPDFKITIKEEFQRKVAKSLVGHLEGAVEKAANVYRQDPTLKSRMILAIENIIAETPHE
jgi:hypothetical protein